MPSFTTSGFNPVGQSQLEVLPSYPQSGWVEHDPDAIISSVGSQVTGALLDAGIKTDRIAAIGLTNQRETTIVWERGHRATDRAGLGLARPPHGRNLRPTQVAPGRGRPADRPGHRPLLFRHQDRLDSRPCLPMLATAPQAGELAAGTVDTFRDLAPDRRTQFVTDATNASRTLLMDLHTIRWAPGLCELFGVPAQILAEIRPSAGDFGVTKGLDYLPDGLPITGRGRRPAGVARRPGLPVGRPGEVHVRHRRVSCWLTRATALCRRTRGLITTLAATLDDGPPQYALEGSVFVAGAAVQWFRDGLKAIGASHEISQLALASDPENELIFVPALTGLGAPALGARRAGRSSG